MAKRNPEYYPEYCPEYYPEYCPEYYRIHSGAEPNRIQLREFPTELADAVFIERAPLLWAIASAQLWAIACASF